MIIAIKRMSVSRANGQPAHWFTAAPGVLPAWGLATRLLMAYGARPKAVGLVLHDWRFDGRVDQRGYLRSASMLRAMSWTAQDDHVSGPENSQFRVLSDQPTVIGDGCFSLLIEVDGDGPNVHGDELKAELSDLRFSGGQIDRVGAVACHQHMSHAEIAEFVGTGFTLASREDLIQREMQAKGCDPLQALLEAVRYRPADELDPAWGSCSWLTPFASGWHFLTDARPRPGARDGLEHAFVEPVVGLGQWVSIRRRGEAPPVQMWRQEASAKPLKSSLILMRPVAA